MFTLTLYCCPVESLRTKPLEVFTPITTSDDAVVTPEIERLLNVLVPTVLIPVGFTVTVTPAPLPTEVIATPTKLMELTPFMLPTTVPSSCTVTPRIPVLPDPTDAGLYATASTKSPA